MPNRHIILRSSDEIGRIRQAGSILAKAINKIRSSVNAGMTTEEVDKIAADEIRAHGGNPAFKGYHGFPGNICASVNEGVVHGIPSHMKLRHGDLLSVDIGVKYKDYYADAAVTIAIGQVSAVARKLIEVTEKALYIGIEKAVAGRHLTDISNAIQEYVESNGFSVVRDLVGHGIGTEIHEEPNIPNFGKAGMGPILEPGMILAIEPMINEGTYEVETLDDGWSVVTKDRKLSAHFEHTIAVTKDVPEILTR